MLRIFSAVGPHRDRRVVGALLLAVVVMACGGDEESPIAPSALPGAEVAPAAAGSTLDAQRQTKTELCHYLANQGDYVLRNINDRALAQHLAHGDAFVGDPFPGMADMFFDATCVPAPAITVFPALGSFLASTGATTVAIPDSATAFPNTSCGYNNTGEGVNVVMAFDSNVVDVRRVQGPSVCVYDVGVVSPPTETDPSVTVANTILGNGEDDYILTFNSPVQAIGFRFLTNNVAREVLTFRDATGSVIQTIDIDAYTPTNVLVFVGFGSLVPIGSLVIDTDGGARQNEGFDQLYAASVP